MTVESNYVILIATHTVVIGIKGLRCLRPMRSKTITYGMLCGLVFLGFEL